jgi:Short C-terminal domain
VGPAGDRHGDPAGRGRAPTGRDATERVIFALVAQRACEPGSKLAANRWVTERVFIDGCGGFSDDAAYAAMDFVLAALDEVAAEIETQDQADVAATPRPPPPYAAPAQPQQAYTEPVAPQQASAAPAQPADMGDRLAQLKQLGELVAAGVLTQAEFEQQKARILNG